MAVLYCGCGYKLWSELWWKESRDMLLFFDDLERSASYGERMTRCPGCSEEIRIGALEPAGVKYG